MIASLLGDAGCARCAVALETCAVILVPGRIYGLCRKTLLNEYKKWPTLADLLGLAVDLLFEMFAS